MHTQVTHFPYPPGTHSCAPISASPTDSETSRTRTHLPSHTPSPHTLSHSPPTNAPGHGHTGRSQVKFQTGPVPGGQRETEEAGHARMRGGGFQRGNSPTRLVSGTERQKLHARPPGSQQFIHTEASAGFGHGTIQMVSSHLAFPRLPHWNSSHCGTNAHSKDRGGVRSLRWPRGGSWVTLRSRPSMTSPNAHLHELFLTRVHVSPHSHRFSPSPVLPCICFTHSFCTLTHNSVANLESGISISGPMNGVFYLLREKL